MYPKHAYRSARQFKAQKRADIREVQKALSLLKLGCAYMPSYDLILKIDDLLLQVKESSSAKKWGR